MCLLPAGLHLRGTHVAGIFAGLEQHAAAKSVIAGLTVLDISEPRPSTDLLAVDDMRASTQDRTDREPAALVRIVACLLRTTVRLKSFMALGMQQLVHYAGTWALLLYVPPACSVQLSVWVSAVYKRFDSFNL